MRTPHPIAGAGRAVVFAEKTGEAFRQPISLSPSPLPSPSLPAGGGGGGAEHLLGHVSSLTAVRFCLGGGEGEGEREVEGCCAGG